VLAFLILFLLTKINHSLSVRENPLFTYHVYSMCWTYLSAYSTAFAVVHIYLDGDSSTNNSIWTIEPA